jgi:hypothetical protein
MLNGLLVSSVKSLFHQINTDNYLDSLKERKVIGALKGTPEYNAQKEIRQNELDLEEKLGFWGRLVIKGNRIMDPGLADMKYVLDNVGGNVSYVPDSMTTVNPMRMLSSNLEVVENYSMSQRIMDFIQGMLFCDVYSIPYLTRSLGISIKPEAKGGNHFVRNFLLGIGIVGIGALGARHLYMTRLAPSSDFDKDGMDRKTEQDLMGRGVDVDPFRKDPVVAA